MGDYTLPPNIINKLHDEGNKDGLLITQDVGKDQDANIQRVYELGFSKKYCNTDDAFKTNWGGYNYNILLIQSHLFQKLIHLLILLY